MSRSGEAEYGPVRSGTGESDRLLRALDELRALEAQRRSVPAGPVERELDRRVEAKAREVFRIAEDVGDHDPVWTDEDARRH